LNGISAGLLGALFESVAGAPVSCFSILLSRAIARGRASVAETLRTAV